MQTLETENMMELAEVLLFAGLARAGVARGAFPHGFSHARRQ